MDPSFANPPKEKKPLTQGQLDRIARDKAAVERILKETGIRVPNPVGSKLLKLEREGGNVPGFLQTIRNTGKGMTRKKPTEVKTTAVATNKMPVMNVPASTQKVKSMKKSKTPTPVVEATAVVAEAVKEATDTLTEEEHAMLSKCERIYDSLMEKTRKNLRNATGRNASNENVTRLFNLRKAGHDMPILNYLKLANGIRKAKTTRRAKHIANVMPKVTKREKETLESFLQENN